MEVYIIQANQLEECKENHWYHQEKEFFVAANQDDIYKLQEIFSFSHETVGACLHKDEGVRLRNFEGYDFISFKYFIRDTKHLETKDLNLFVGANYVILVGEEAPHIVEQIKEYVITKMNPPFVKRKSLNKIYYLIWEWIIMHYSNTMIEIEDVIESLEEEIIEESKKGHFEEINDYRKIIRKMKKYIRPLLYIGDELLVNDNSIVQKEMVRYFKNIDIRINKLYDFVEDLLEMADQVRTIYDSKQASRTNQIATNITKLVAIITPLTIITGLYGMNFEFMPELHWKYGYLFAIFLMILCAVIIYWFMKKKKWISN